MNVKYLHTSMNSWQVFYIHVYVGLDVGSLEGEKGGLKEKH